MKKTVARNILLNPGPATTTDTVKMSQVVPDICPREKEFQNIMFTITNDLLKIVNADAEKYCTTLFAGSGTICIDAILSSLLPSRKKILIINNGSYSQRGVDVCSYYNLPFVDLKYDLNKTPNLFDIEEILKKDTEIHLVYTTHHETGTGLLNPIRDIGKLVHKYNRVFAVDTTSTFAMIPLDMENDNLDFIMSSSQKGIGAMSGVAFVIGNRELLEKSKNYPKRSYYCNLYRQYNYFNKTGQMHFTPPVQTLYSIRKALDELSNETLQEKMKRHEEAFETLYNGLKKLGFTFYVDKPINSKVLLSILYPNDINWNFEKIHDFCYERGYTIYPGKVIDIPSFRLSIFGAIDSKDINNFFIVFEEAIRKFNINIPIQY